MDVWQTSSEDSRKQHEGIVVDHDYISRLPQVTYFVGKGVHQAEVITPSALSLSDCYFSGTTLVEQRKEEAIDKPSLSGLVSQIDSFPDKIP